MRAREFLEPQSAGCILRAADTGRWCLQKRSHLVAEPGVWACWGGGREPGETLEDTVRRELAEEGGYIGPIELTPAPGLSSPDYAAFIGVVPREFEPHCNHEVADWQWFDADHPPAPLHPSIRQLNEIGNQPADYQADKRRTRSAFHAQVDGHAVSVFFDRSPINGALQITFTVDGNYELSPDTGRQLPVFRILSTVLRIVKEKLPEYQRLYGARRVTFTAQGQRARASVYEKYFVPVITQILGSKYQYDRRQAFGNDPNSALFRWVRPASSQQSAVTEQAGPDYMGGHCHVMALALRQLNPTWRLRAHIGWEEDAENDSDYRIDHVYVVDPATGRAYDCRGSFANEQALISAGNYQNPYETQFVDYSLEDLRRDVRRGELARFTAQDVERAMAFAQQLKENFADGRKPGRKGLSRRVGIPKKATLGRLEKIAKSSTGERRRMAQWQLNMRRGKLRKK